MIKVSKLMLRVALAGMKGWVKRYKRGHNPTRDKRCHPPVPLNPSQPHDLCTFGNLHIFPSCTFAICTQFTFNHHRPWDHDEERVKMSVLSWLEV